MNILHFQRFIGKQIKDVADEIDKEAKKMGLRVNYLVPDGIPNLDEDMKRLNVHITNADIVLGFSFG